MHDKNKSFHLPSQHYERWLKQQRKSKDEFSCYLKRCQIQMNSLHQVENWATGGSFSCLISKLCFQQHSFLVKQFFLK